MSARLDYSQWETERIHFLNALRADSALLWTEDEEETEEEATRQ